MKVNGNFFSRAGILGLAMIAVPVLADDLNITSFSPYAGLTSIVLQASGNITFSGGPLTLSDSSTPCQLTVIAGNNISVADSCPIAVGNNWNVTMIAGTNFSGSVPSPGNGGIYLNDNAYIQTRNGNINLAATNEVQIASDSSAGADGVRTLGGGNISVTTLYGDVNAGGNMYGFDINNSAAPYYTVDLNVGGISTAAGGNVSITAGGSVYSFVPLGDLAGLTTSDAGTGAFGPEAGNVTITAGSGVYGHYVLANGVGRITAQGGDVGGPFGSQTFALSLINGSWNINAPQGNIYLQEVRDPNGVNNNLELKKLHQPVQLAGYHLFDYGVNATVNLNAGVGVYLTDYDLPRPNDAVPVLYPPELSISAGPGGVTLEGAVTLYPSPDQNLSVATTGGGTLSAEPNPSGSQYELLMSDSAQNRWPTSINGIIPFSDQDHGTLSAEPTDPTPVTINISGSIEDLTLLATKVTGINVGGNMINCNFSGQNLHSSDVTSINVAGQIYNQSAYTYVDGVSIPSMPTADLPNGVANNWDTVFLLAMDPTRLASLVVPGTVSPQNYYSYALQYASVFEATDVNGRFSVSSDQGFVYTAATGRLWYGGPMSATLLTELSRPISILRLNTNGTPVLDANGHFVTDIYNWVSPSVLSTLSVQSQMDPSSTAIQAGYRLGGAGAFDITAGSISLGNSYGILSCGNYDPQTSLGNRYGNLAPITPSSANLNIEITGPDQTSTEVYQLHDGVTLNILPHASLAMHTSTIATLGGGNVTANSLMGSMDLGSPQPFNNGPYIGLGVYSAAGGNVTVTAQGDVNIDGSRVATYDGGNIFIESFNGNVDAGSGGGTQTGVLLGYAYGGLPGYYQEYVYGSGITAYTLVPASPAVLAGGDYAGYPPTGSSVGVAENPGNITVLTPKGNITATLAGITQQALDGTNTAGPTIDLEAGTSAAVDSSLYTGTIYTGNIDLGDVGVVGDTVILKATGNITGLIISGGSPPSGVVSGAVSTVNSNLSSFVSALAGTNVTLSVALAGTVPISYQWFLNGSALLNQTNPFLSLPSLHRSDEGTYTLSISNAQATVQYTFQLHVVAPQILAMTPEAGGQTLRISLGDMDGEFPTAQDISSFIVQSSPDLVNWSTVSPTLTTNASGGLFFDVPISGGSGGSYYRVLSQ